MKFVYTAHTLNAVIATSNSKLHHTSILGQWICVCLLCIRKQFKANADTKTIIFVATISDQIKVSGEKYVLATLNY